MDTHKPGIFARIDRTLAECDARQLPPVNGPVPPAIPVAEAARRLGYEPADLNVGEPEPVTVHIEPDTPRWQGALDRVLAGLFRRRT